MPTRMTAQQLCLQPFDTCPLIETQCFPFDRVSFEIGSMFSFVFSPEKTKLLCCSEALIRRRKMQLTSPLRFGRIGGCDDVSDP